MTTIMWLVFHVLALLGTFIVVERSLFHLRTPLADELSLLRRLLDWECSIRLDLTANSKLGWLNPLLSDCGNDIEKLWLLANEMCRLSRRAQNLNGYVREIAMLVGMFGTMWGLRLGGNGNPQLLIGVGIGSSIYGLVIAICLFVTRCVLSGRTDLIASQTDNVLNVIEENLRRTRLAAKRRDAIAHKKAQVAQRKKVVKSADTENIAVA